MRVINFPSNRYKFQIKNTLRNSSLRHLKAFVIDQIVWRMNKRSMSIDVTSSIFFNGFFR